MSSDTIRAGARQLKELDFPNWASIREMGAKGDGVSDDAAAFNKAFLAERPIFIPQGTYLVSSPLMPISNSYLFGGGPLSIVKAAPNFGDVPIFRNYDWQATSLGSRTSGFTLENFAIDGNRANNLTAGEHSAGVQLRGTLGATVRNMWIYDCLGDGVSIQETPGHSEVYCSNTLLEGLTIRNVWRCGVAITSGERTRIAFLLIDGTDREAGIDLEPNNSLAIVRMVTITGCQIFNVNKCGIVFALAQILSQNCEGLIASQNLIQTTRDSTYGHGMQATGGLDGGIPFTWEHNEVYDTASYGYHYDASARDGNLSNCFAQRTAKAGFRIVGQEFKLRGCKAITQNQIGFLVEGGGSYGSLEGCTAKVTGNVPAVRMDNTVGVDVLGGYFKGPGNTQGVGVRILNGQKCLVSGIKARDLAIGVQSLGTSTVIVSRDSRFWNVAVEFRDDTGGNLLEPIGDLQATGKLRHQGTEIGVFGTQPYVQAAWPENFESLRAGLSDNGWFAAPTDPLPLIDIFPNILCNWDASQGAFQDTGLTTPCDTHGQSVKGRQDQVIASSSHLIQAVTANAPLYHTNVQNSLPGIFFDGSNDYLSCNSLTSLFAGTNIPFTYGAVFKPANLTGRKNLMATGSSVSTSPFDQCQLNAATLELSRRDAAGASASVSGGAVTLATYFVMYVSNGVYGWIYLNGALVAEGALTGLGAASPNTYAQGALDRQTGPVSLFSGYMFEDFLVMEVSSGKRAGLAHLSLKDKWGYP